MEKFLKSRLFWLVLMGAIVFGFILITVPPIFSNHFLYNLEPYPDGLLYALSGRNFALGKELQLAYEGSELKLWVPPLYAVTLSLGYVFWSDPTMFYLTNVVLSVITLFALMWLVTQMTKNYLAGFLTGVVYFVHAYIVWLPTVPMSENLALLSLVLALYGLLLPNRKWSQLIGVVGIVSLFLTRYAVIVTVGTISLLLIYKLVRTQNSRTAKMTMLGLGILIAAVVAILALVDLPLWITATNFFSSLVNGSSFYSFSFLPMNALQYGLSFLGVKTPFLWLKFALTSAFITLPCFYWWIKSLKMGSPENRWQALVLSLTFLSQLPLLLLFYTVDSRYLVLTIPLLAISFGLMGNAVLKSRALKVWGIAIVLLLGLHGLTQASLFRQIIVNNWFHRSQAWQYEAILDFNRLAETKSGAQIITALPPFLVDAYQVGEYRVLPLSTTQEFIDKKQFVWGDDINYDNLVADYQGRVESGQDLYITNAYITHQQSVIADYEAYKQLFDFELVQEGCQQACNIYRLKLIESEGTP